MIRVSYNGKEFTTRSTFEERHIPRDAGFSFDRERKLWYAISIQTAARLRPYLDESAKNEINRTLLCYEPWSGPVPYPSGLTPLDFQVPSARFALSRNRSYLGLDPGLGKTVVAALIANAKSGDYFLYICPPFLAPNVKIEMEKWLLTHGNSISISISIWNSKRMSQARVMILPDSILENENILRAVHNICEFYGQNTDVNLIIDEAHRYKTPSSKRSKALFEKIAPLFKNQTWMSGTPMPNRPIELFPILSYAAPQTIGYMRQFEFARRYCDAKHNGFGWDYSGAKNVPELADRVLIKWKDYQVKDDPEKFMLRIKKEVLNLPPKLEEMVFIGDELPPKIGALDKKVSERFGGEDDMEKEIAKELGHDTVHLATYRKELGKEKAHAAIPLIKSILEETDENLILCTWHREAASLLIQGLEKYAPILIDGSVDVSKRVPLANEFQSNPARRLIVLNIIAGGIGLNLQKANRVVFVEFSWVPGENDQASDRAHRYGQRGSVLVQYLVYRNSIDRVVIETVLNKRRATKIV